VRAATARVGSGNSGGRPGGRDVRNVRGPREWAGQRGGVGAGVRARGPREVAIGIRGGGCLPGGWQARRARGGWNLGGAVSRARAGFAGGRGERGQSTHDS
jgi:hypothetical protein